LCGCLWTVRYPINPLCPNFGPLLSMFAAAFAPRRWFRPRWARHPLCLSEEGSRSTSKGRGDKPRMPLKGFLLSRRNSCFRFHTNRPCSWERWQWRAEWGNPGRLNRWRARRLAQMGAVGTARPDPDKRTFADSCGRRARIEAASGDLVVPVPTVAPGASMRTSTPRAASGPRTSTSWWAGTPGSCLRRRPAPGKGHRRGVAGPGRRQVARPGH